MTSIAPEKRTLPDVTLDAQTDFLFIHPREHGAAPHGPMGLRDAYRVLSEGWGMSWRAAVVYGDRPIVARHNRLIAESYPALRVVVDRRWGGYAYLCAGGTCHRSGGWDSPGGAAMNGRAHRSSDECRYAAGVPYDRIRYTVHHDPSGPANRTPATAFEVDGERMNYRAALDRAVEMCGDADAGRDLIVAAECEGYTRTAPGMLSVEAAEAPRMAESLCADGACQASVRHFPDEVYTDAMNHLDRSPVCRARPKIVREGSAYRIEGSPPMSTTAALAELGALWGIGEPFASGLLCRAPKA